MEGMFFECGSLASLDVSSFDTSRVTTMLRMFYNCGSLAELDISGFDMTNVEDDTEMLAGTRWNPEPTAQENRSEIMQYR